MSSEAWSRISILRSTSTLWLILFYIYNIHIPFYTYYIYKPALHTYTCVYIQIYTYDYMYIYVDINTYINTYGIHTHLKCRQRIKIHICTYFLWPLLYILYIFIYVHSIHLNKIPLMLAYIIDIVLIYTCPLYIKFHWWRLYLQYTFI